MDWLRFSNPRVRWAYHGTSSTKLSSIARHGLRLSTHDGESILFFSASTYYAAQYGGSEDVSDAPFPFGVLLRFPWPKGAEDVTNQVGDSAFVSRDTIPSDKIDVYVAPVPDGRLRPSLWVPLQTVVKDRLMERFL